MLAYSSISQVGYIVLGLGLGTPLGIAGGLFHLINHALAKGLLFLNSGSVQQATGTRNLDEMGGLAKRMPVTAATNLVGSLSIAGVPPLNGFWSKLIIIVALVQAGQLGIRRGRRPGQRPDALVLPRSSSARPSSASSTSAGRTSRRRRSGCWPSNIILALLCIGIGIFFALTIKTWIQPAADALGQGVRISARFLGNVNDGPTNHAARRIGALLGPGDPRQGPPPVRDLARRRPASCSASSSSG